MDDGQRAELFLRLARAQREVVRLERELEVARGQATLQRSNAAEARAREELLRAAVRAVEADLVLVPMILKTIRRTGQVEDLDELSRTLERVKELLDAAMRDPVG